MNIVLEILPYLSISLIKFNTLSVLKNHAFNSVLGLDPNILSFPPSRAQRPLGASGRYGHILLFQLYTPWDR